MAKDPPIEKVNDILLDLERARKKEKEEKEIAEALLKSLESISNFNQKSDDLFMELSSKVSSIIEFKEFAILMNKPTYQDCLKVFFSNGLENYGGWNEDTDHPVERFFVESIEISEKY